jgi:hypothetical protein
MMRALMIAGIASLMAAPALAGQGLMCDGPDGLHADVPLGGGAGLSVLSADIRVKGKRWTTDAKSAGATPIVAWSAAAVDDRMYIDFSDFRGETIVIRIRLFRAGIEDLGAVAGLIDIAGERAWPISCDFG